MLDFNGRGRRELPAPASFAPLPGRRRCFSPALTHCGLSRSLRRSAERVGPAVYPGAPLRSAPRLPYSRPLRGFRRLPPAASPSVVDRSLRRRVAAEAPGGVRGIGIPGSEREQPAGACQRPHHRCARGDRGQSRPHPFATSPCGREAAQEQPRRVRRSPGEDRSHRNFRMESEICIFQEKAVTLPTKTHTYACAPGGERPAKQIGADRF